jgi:nitrate/nitrite transporter NarK
MAGFYRMVTFAFWILGLLTTVVLLVGRIARPLRGMLEDRLELRSLLWLAGVFFLGAIATLAVARTSKD